MKPGDWVVIWREKYLSDEQKKMLIGRKAVIRDVVVRRNAWYIIEHGEYKIRGKHDAVVELLDEAESVHVVSLNAMRKIPREKPRLGSWNECPFNPLEKE